MSALTMLEISDTATQPWVSGDHQLYNLNRLIEMCPDAMSANDCVELKFNQHASDEAILKRRQSDDSGIVSEDRLRHLSEDTKNYFEKLVEQRVASHYRQAHFDTLTHLPNRAHFQHRLQKALLNQSEPFSLLFLDLDGFKAVNDNFSHQIGDELLQLVSARLQSAVREEDFISRLGGDEFCIIVLETNSDNLGVVCQRIITEVSRAYWIQNQEVRISTSIGIAHYPSDAKFANELINFADQALYYSKHQGKRQAHFYAKIPKAMLDAQAATQSKNIENFGLQKREWRNSDNAMQLYELLPIDREGLLSYDEVIEVLHSATSVSRQVIASWLWDSAEFHLDHLPAVQQEKVVLRLSAELFAELDFAKTAAQSRDYSKLGISMTAKEWALLDEEVLQTWQKMQAAGIQGFCEIKQPWALDWAMIEALGIEHLCLSNEVMQQLSKQPQAIQSLFKIAVQQLGLQNWMQSLS